MSKSLRMLLLSMLMVVVAALPAMATNYPTKFEWTGAAGNNSWGDVGNWSADIAYSADMGAANAYYPGKVSASVQVIISKDADIYLDQQSGNGFTTGALSKISGISIDKRAKVSIDLGAYGYFINVPNIEVVSGSLKLTGTRTLTIDSTPTWKSSGPLTLDLPVTFGPGKKLTLSVDNALTINNASLMSSTDIRVAKSAGKLVLNASPAASTAASTSRRGLSITLFDGAKLETPSDITITANYTPRTTSSVVITAEKLVKTGAGTLTLTRATPLTSYDAVIDPSVKSIAVKAGSLVLAGSRPIKSITSAPLSIDVAANANFAVSASRAINTNQTVWLTVRANGSATVNASGIGSADTIYTSNELDLGGFNLSADVYKDGTLTFKGTQPVKELKGAGTVVVNGTDSVLIIDGTSEDVSGFTGTLKATNVGLSQSFDNMPFENAASMDMAAVYVYGGAVLTLDAAKLPDGMDETMIFLRSNYNSASEAALTSSIVGSLAISGDVTLGTLRADGSKNLTAFVELPTSKDALTVNSLVLHANRPLDKSTTAPTYSAVDALVISGDGTFTPKAMSNATSDGGLGSNQSIVVEGATLKLGVDVPAYNSLLLNSGKLDAANGVSIPGDFTVQAGEKANYIKVAVLGSNASGLHAEGHNALNVGGNLSINGVISVDMTLDDPDRFLGKRYKLIGPAGSAFSKVNSKDVSFDVVGTYDGVMHVSYDISGVYGILEKFIQVPRLGSKWNVKGDPTTFGSGRSEFVATISYDIPENVTPEGLINLIVVSVDIAGKQFSSNGTTRDRVVKNGKDVVYISSLEVSSPDKMITLTGTSYVTKLDTKVALGWSSVSTDWVPYEKSMYYGSRKIESQDFRPLDYEDREISNPIDEESHDVPISDDKSLSEDVIANPDEVALDADVHTVIAGSDDVVLTVTGIRRLLLTGSNGFVPVLVNGSYMWMNGYDPATDKFEMLFDGNYRLVSLDIKINGVSVNMASVDIEGSDPVTVTIPAAFFTTTLAYTAPQEIVIVGTTPNGKTITTEPVSVWVKPASGYQAGTIDAEYVGRGASDTAVTRKVADIPLGGTISFDVTGGTMPDEWIDFDGVKAGVISFTVPAGTAAGVYTKTIDVYTAEGGYTYTFSYEVVEGFKINDPDEPYGTIGGLNYEARFTAANAPAGAVVEWDFPTNIAWLKSAKSGDVFVIYGQLPGYINDEEAEDDPNEHTYRVVATVGGETISKDWTITIEEDTDETVPPEQFAAGSISGDVSTADKNYSVVINFNEDNYDTELDFVSLPYWLKATPVTSVVDGTEVITGYTITYKTDTDVTTGESGVVRFEDPAGDGQYVSWPVIFTTDTTPPAAQLEITASPNTLTFVEGADLVQIVTMTANVDGVTYTTNKEWARVISGENTIMVTAPESSDVITVTGTDPAGRTATTTITVTVTPYEPLSPDEPGSQFMYSVTGSTTVSVALAARDTSITITPRNVRGTVSYTSSASWVTVNSSTGVVTINPTDSSLVRSTPYNVTITLTDSGRTTANTQTVTLTITVTSGGVISPDQPSVQDLSLRVSPSSLNITLGNSGTVTLSANVLGTATYSMNAPEEVGGILSGDTAVFVPDEAGTYNVTFTVVDSGRTTGNNTATATLTINVTLPSSSVGSSGGGCDAGFGALALALALPFFLRRRRS